MTQTSDELISSYLGRLQAACWPLDVARTTELVEGISDHIRDAAAELGDDPTTVAGILDRLGPPERIAQEAAEQPPTPAGPLLVERPSLTHEIWTVALLGIGGFVLPFISWIAGLVLLLTSRRWLWWEKLLGILIVPGGPIGGIILLSIGARTSHTALTACQLTGSGKSCELSGRTHMWPGASIALVVLALLGPLIVSAFLWFRAKSRASSERPQLIPATYTALA